MLSLVCKLYLFCILCQLPRLCIIGIFFLYLNRLNSVCYNLKQTLIGTESIGAYMVKLITFLFQVKLEEIASYYILNV